MGNVEEEGADGVVIVGFTGLPGVAGFDSKVGWALSELSCIARLQQHVAALKFWDLSKKIAFGLCWLILLVDEGQRFDQFGRQSLMNLDALREA